MTDLDTCHPDLILVGRHSVLLEGVKKIGDLSRQDGSWPKSLLGGQDDNPVETGVGEEVVVHADARCAVFCEVRKLSWV